MIARIARGLMPAALGVRNDARQHYARRLERLVATRQDERTPRAVDAASAHAADRPGRAVAAAAGL